jgi:hypothetical protein
MVAFIIAYILMLFAYYYTRTSGKMHLRAPNKVILATMYFVFAVVQFQTNYELLSYHLLLMVALFLAWMGDVFLMFDFNRGGDFFLCGNICFFTYELVACIEQGHKLSDFWWIIPLTVILVGLFALFAHRYPDTLKLGKMKWPMTLYLTSITLHGLMGLALTILLPGSKLALMGLGSLLFMISDYILTVDRFIILNNKWIVRSNSTFYFIGLLLIVLSMA